MKIVAKNKRAGFEYFFIEKFTVGIVLTGTEIKSIRTGKVTINEAYCSIFKEELWLKNMHIAEYDHGNIYNHEPRRDRKLLLTKKELKKIRAKHVEKGITIVPTLLFINDKGLAKLEIALAKGKKLYDKRDTIKDRDVIRESERKIKL
jgi:SsrA-binding protein